VNSATARIAPTANLRYRRRVKDIIIKGGRNLYPHEVEELAARAEGIRKGCVVAFGLTDEAAGTEKNWLSCGNPRTPTRRGVRLSLPQ